MTERAKAALKAAVLIVGGAIFFALLLDQRFPIKSCADLKRMYEPMVGVNCGE